MLRLLVLLLLVANLAFFAWAQGWLGSEATEAVPPRTEVEADRVVVLPRHPIAALQAATTPATTPASSVDQAAICIEAGPFNDEEFADVEQRVRQVLPGLAWATVTRASPAQWAVYMGPFASEEQLDRKQEELRRMDDLRFEVLRSPPAWRRASAWVDMNRKPLRRQLWCSSASAASAPPASCRCALPSSAD